MECGFTWYSLGDTYFGMFDEKRLAEFLSNELKHNSIPYSIFKENSTEKNKKTNLWREKLLDSAGEKWLVQYRTDRGSLPRVAFEKLA